MDWQVDVIDAGREEMSDAELAALFAADKRTKKQTDVDVDISVRLVNQTILSEEDLTTIITNAVSGVTIAQERTVLAPRDTCTASYRLPIRS